MNELTIALFSWMTIRGPITVHLWSPSHHTVPFSETSISSICKHVLQSEISSSHTCFKFTTIPSLKISVVSCLFMGKCLASKSTTTFSLSIILPHSFVPHYVLIHHLFSFYLAKSSAKVQFLLNSNKLGGFPLSLDALNLLNTPISSLLNVFSSVWSPDPIPITLEECPLFFAEKDINLEQVALLLTSFLSTGSVFIVGKNELNCMLWSRALLSFLTQDYDRLLCSGYKEDFYLPGLVIQSCNNFPALLCRKIIRPITIVEFFDESIDSFRIRQSPLLPFFQRSKCLFISHSQVSLNSSQSDEILRKFDYEVPLAPLSSSVVDPEVRLFVCQLYKLPIACRTEYLEAWLQSQWRRALALVNEIRGVLQSEGILKLSQPPPNYILNMAEVLCPNLWSCFEDLAARVGDRDEHLFRHIVF
ncbi:hypothetical protein RCL1_004272 [Eukaryota sp. TZLM3-RCL]